MVGTRNEIMREVAFGGGGSERGRGGGGEGRGRGRGWGLCEYVIVHTIWGGSRQAEMASIEIWIP